MIESDQQKSQVFIGPDFWVNVNESPEETRNRQAHEKSMLKKRYAIDLASLRATHKSEKKKLKELRSEAKKNQKQKLLASKRVEGPERKALKLELKNLRANKRILNRECFIQLSHLQRYELSERKAIIEEFKYLKKMNSVKIRMIMVQLDPTRASGKVENEHPVLKTKPKRFRKSQIQKLFQECVEKNVLPVQEIIDVCGLFSPKHEIRSDSLFDGLGS
jgi:hypothetical protein